MSAEQAVPGQGMVISNKDILHLVTSGEVIVRPFAPEDVGSFFLTLHLDKTLLIPTGTNGEPILNPRGEQNWVTVEFSEKHPYYLRPRSYLLGNTQEHIELPDNIVGHLGSLRPAFIAVGDQFKLGGWVDPGWKGQLTIAMFNNLPVAIKLIPGLPICRLVLLGTETPVARPYGSEQLGSKYQGSAGPVGSRYHEEQQ